MGPVSVVPVWRLFAFMDDDHGERDERRLLAEWQVADALRWCVTRGYDHIYLCRSSEAVTFERVASPPQVRHSGPLRGVRDGDHTAGEPERPVA